MCVNKNAAIAPSPMAGLATLSVFIAHSGGSLPSSPVCLSSLWKGCHSHRCCWCEPTWRRSGASWHRGLLALLHCCSNEIKKRKRVDNPLCLSCKHIRAQSQKSLQARLSGVFGMIQSFGLDSSTSFVRWFIVSRLHCRTYCYYSKPLQCNVLWKGAKTVGGGVIHWNIQDIYKHGEVELNWVMWLNCCLCPSCKLGRGTDLLTEICLTMVVMWRLSVVSIWSFSWLTSYVSDETTVPSLRVLSADTA